MKRTGNQVLGSTTLNIPVAAGENMKECTIAAINASGYAVTGKKAEGPVPISQNAENRPCFVNGLRQNESQN